MDKNRVTTPAQALEYLTECTLATVCDMASKKSRPKGEFERQISMAQSGLDWLRGFSHSLTSPRCSAVATQFKGSVSKWAEQYLPTAQREPHGID